jgi:DNA-binding transcriptional ArsR family regulator
MPAKQKPTGPEDVLLSILQHPLRKRLLRFYVEAEGSLSPKELTLLANDPKISNVGYHVRVLAEKGAVELVKTQPRRGSVEHFYEATDLVDEVPWGRAALGVGRAEPWG